MVNAYEKGYSEPRFVVAAETTKGSTNKRDPRALFRNFRVTFPNGVEILTDYNKALYKDAGGYRALAPFMNGINGIQGKMKP